MAVGCHWFNASNDCKILGWACVLAEDGDKFVDYVLSSKQWETVKDKPHETHKSNMNYRTLGKTELKVSEIGYGIWAIAGDSGFWDTLEPAQIMKNFYRYTELGGNFIDTAYVYGWDGKDSHSSEELIGRFIKESGKRDDVIIASKIPGKNMKWPAWRGIEIDEVFPSSWWVLELLISCNFMCCKMTSPSVMNGRTQLKKLLKLAR